MRTRLFLHIGRSFSCLTRSRVMNVRCAPLSTRILLKRLKNWDWAVAIAVSKKTNCFCFSALLVVSSTEVGSDHERIVAPVIRVESDFWRLVWWDRWHSRQRDEEGHSVPDGWHFLRQLKQSFFVFAASYRCSTFFALVHSLGKCSPYLPVYLFVKLYSNN